MILFEGKLRKSEPPRRRRITSVLQGIDIWPRKEFNSPWEKTHELKTAQPGTSLTFTIHSADDTADNAGPALIVFASRIPPRPLQAWRL